MSKSQPHTLLYPIRHHSPACAWHLARLIRDRKPRAILIEGPRDATPLIAHLVHPQTRTPVAIYTTFVDRKNMLGLPDHDRQRPPRFAAYYPLADYSPELVAMREGHAIGAHMHFIDLPFPAMVLAEHHEQHEQVRSLFSERYFAQSRYLQALCERTGTRDPDDLWDHLYESDFLHPSTDEFIRRVDTYCTLARTDYNAEMLAAEGHTAREQAMAAAIAAEAARSGGLVLAVTGGFHTQGLRDLLAQEPPPGESARQPPASEQENQTLLMRYGFAQLDRLNGYASGMPSPAFYQRVWEQASAEHPPQSAAHTAAAFIVELARQTRERMPGLSPADEIAALDHTRRLAAFRGHPLPTREDLLDGIRSAFVKGALDGEGLLVMQQAQTLLTGSRIGVLPPDVGVAPLVEDFRRAAAQHRLDIASLEARDVTLDLYRKAGHRAASRFFYRLDYLGVPFAKLLRGPDFVKGRDLARVQEVWRYAWKPATESTLTERSLYGGTLEEACAALLHEERTEAEIHGQGRRADVAAAHLLRACRMGLHRFAPDLLRHTVALVAEDSLFPSLVHTAEQLLVLHHSREPLEAHDLEGVADVAAEAYERACYLLPQLATTPEEEELTVLDALNSMHHLMLASASSERHTRLRHTGLHDLLATRAGSAVLRGAAAGSLFSDGALDEPDLVRWTAGHLAGSMPAPDTEEKNPRTLSSGPAFLRGLLRVNRACLWQVPTLLRELNRTIATWKQEQFVRLLPELRLAFADLTARECDEVARNVAALPGAREVPSLRLNDMTDADLLLGAALNGRVEDLLRRDGLWDFVENLADEEGTTEEAHER